MQMEVNLVMMLCFSRYVANAYTLRNKIRLIDVWLCDRVSGVVNGEVHDVTDKSFVIGWPTNNYVATFKTLDLKRIWFEQLQK